MKKLFSFIIVFHVSIGFSQVKLASHPLKLKKSADYHQILAGVNKQNQVYVFATDKENFHVLKFNSALFFADSLHLKRPEKPYEIMAGYSFGKNGKPYVYWASDDFKKIEAVAYDWNNTPTVNRYELPLKKESIVDTFTENGIFYILTRGDSEGFLKIYSFNDGNLTEKQLDFAAYQFMDSRGKPAKLSEILSDYPIEKMDSRNYNPLFYSVQKSKLYVQGNSLILTLDHNAAQTQILSVDLETFTVSETTIAQPRLQNNDRESNSFFFDKKLYQLSLNQDQMEFQIKQFPSGKLIKDFSVSKKDTIAFKNSPLYIQNGNGSPGELKTTQKFLRKLSASAVGLSVYNTQEATLVTIGRAKNIARTGDILLGVTLTVGAAMGGGIYTDDLFENSVQSIYFESLLDKDLQHLAGQPEPLAVDHISEFLASHDEVRNDTVLYYNDFFIMGYYDTGTEEYVLRKFQDGFN